MVAAGEITLVLLLHSKPFFTKTVSQLIRFNMHIQSKLL